ncbi:uncharacterized protein THITE_2122728 [Thermothielavioides terrestris NRRL 8126]|uniref:RING-type domain-containing protein n=1 Tax=Thermothielavioides terrestris (strain ATCC 38088 / NRRL 8126) TaxID=578455 RepID=G2RE02_THETT|nr:uncharacterized protein THITE_2122728 [Thermothielavioides terrestris NRRL 8126]AEO70885.1 hypothetical protein THITE_2122728 [Thermothielavioides terrestris NRRL 8126]
MGLSGLLGASSSDRSVSPKNTASTSAALSRSPSPSHPGPTQPEHIVDEADLPPVDPEPPDLRELNACLGALAAVFPDVQIEVFREMFASFSGESRLALVADALLKNRVSWVKGRWKVSANDGRTEEVVVPKKELFRSPEYKQAVMSLAWHEFKGLSRSTINAVLAEHNYSYLDARQTLVDLSSKSWRFTISSLFLRRKPVSARDAENHPLVVWKPAGQGSVVPSLKSTGNAELDRELFDALVAPLAERIRAERETKDREVAAKLNSEEAEKADSLIECACCFTESTFEEFTACTANGHLICFRCVQHSISEAVFGQGWQRSINKETGTLRCPAVESEDCRGCIPQDHMLRAMLQEKKGAEILHKLEQRLADQSLLSSNLPLIRCPFCEYAEVDDIYLPASETDLRPRIDNITSLVLIFCIICCSPILFALLLLSSLVAVLANSKETFGDQLITALREALVRRRRRRRGLRFQCRNPDCQRASCLSCQKAWVDVHVCNESSLVALRTQVEQAMSMAVKRVCPRCNTSFVKTAGCNKLTCPCGYKMCYVCRKDIGGTGDGPDVGYRHFCEHFRPEGDARKCSQCSKCNLWESEDTEEVLRKAKEEAERRWMATEKRDLSGAERAFLETGLPSQPAARGGVGALLRRKGQPPTLADFCDMVLDTVLV